MFFLFFAIRMLNDRNKIERCTKMKKFVAFVLSASMCLSLLTMLTPAFAYEQESEQTIQARMVDPDKNPKPEREPYEGQSDWP